MSSNGRKIKPKEIKKFTENFNTLLLQRYVETIPHSDYRNLSIDIYLIDNSTFKVLRREEESMIEAVCKDLDINYKNIKDNLMIFGTKEIKDNEDISIFIDILFMSVTVMNNIGWYHCEYIDSLYIGYTEKIRYYLFLLFVMFFVG